MVDHVRTLLINPTGHAAYRFVTDEPSDVTMPLFGVTGPDVAASVVDSVLPLAMSADLANFRRFFDSRVSPPVSSSVYRHAYGTGLPPIDGLYASVLGKEGWWRISGLFTHSDPSTMSVLIPFRDAAASKDAPFALGAVLLTVAYRRLLLQDSEA